MRARVVTRAPRVASLAAALAVLACGGRASAAGGIGGDPRAGRASLAIFGCGACHTIPGVDGARGVVGPPLTAFARRTFIGGELPNTPDNLVRWIIDPQSLIPRTAMPTLGVVEPTARDMAAYLYTLQ